MDTPCPWVPDIYYMRKLIQACPIQKDGSDRRLVIFNLETSVNNRTEL